MHISGAIEPPLSSTFGIWVIAASLWLSGCVTEDASVKDYVLKPIPRVGEPFAVGSREIYYRDYELGTGEFVHLVAEQHGIDVSVRWQSPEGEILHAVDSPNGKQGTEELVLIAEAPRTYRFEIVGPGADVSAGEVIFRELARRQATVEDRDLVRADRAYYAAEDLLSDAKYSKALSKLRGALEIWIRLESSRREADTRLALGLVHRSSNEGELAIAYCEQAISIYRELNDSLMTAVALNRVGVIGLRLGQVRRSLAHFEEAASLFRAVGEHKSYASALANIGTTHQRLGDFRQAWDYLERAMIVVEESDLSLRVRARVLIKQGNVLFDLNQPRAALSRFGASKKIYRQLDDDRLLANVLNRAAIAAIRLDELDKAEEDLAEAIEILKFYQERGERVDRDLALSYIYLSRVKTKRDEFTEAHEDLQVALELSRQAEDRQIEGMGLLDSGHLLVLEGKSVEGKQWIDQAFELFSTIEDPVGQAVARDRGAKALRDLGDLEMALEHLAPALDTAERLRDASDRSDVRTGYFAFRQEFFDTAIEILMDLHGRDRKSDYHVRALEIHERRRAREFLDVLNEATTVSRQQVDEVLLAEEERLEEELRTLTGSVQVEEFDEKVGRLVDRLREIRGEIRQAVQRRVAVPAKSPVRLEEIRESVLDEDSLILVYSLADEASYLWAISSETVEAHELPTRRKIENLARQFSEGLPSRKLKIKDSRVRAARKLSELLLAPALTESEARRLVVIASGDLQRVPFSALPVPGAILDDDYLIRSYEVVMLPSISSIVSLRQALTSRPTPERSIAAFADPVFRSDDPRVGADTDAEQEPPDDTSEAGMRFRAQERAFSNLGFDPYQRLRHSRKEVDTILGLVPAQDNLLVVDFAASRATFAQQSLSDYRILHFATHAFQDQTYPELSGLVLSLVDERGEPQDGFLRAFEISRLNLPVELVVLSACQTGRGQSVPGEGVMGLTRAFFNAGAGRVVSSLWRVSDRSTARLMTEFYRAYLGEGLAPSAALRHAQLKMLEDKETEEPLHWAGFIFQGEWLQVLPAQP